MGFGNEILNGASDEQVFIIPVALLPFVFHSRNPLTNVLENFSYILLSVRRSGIVIPETFLPLAFIAL